MILLSKDRENARSFHIRFNTIIWENPTVFSKMLNLLFLAMLAVWLWKYQSVGQSIGQSTTLVQTEISQLWWIAKKCINSTLIVPRRWILMTLVILWFFLMCHHEVDICSFEWSFSTTAEWIAMKFDILILVSLRINCNNLADPLTLVDSAN